MARDTSQNNLGPVRYIPAFDGLRALCITAVIATHVLGGRDHPWVRNIAERGWVGVDVFFVLSGFLITWIISDEIDRDGYVNLRRFYWHRLLRIQPAYFSGLVMNLILLSHFNHQRFLQIAYAMPFFLTYTTNIALSFGVLDNQLAYLQTWSICIEEQFYLLWPLALRRFGTRACLRIVGFLIVAIFVYRSALYLWFATGSSSAASDWLLSRIYYGSDTRIDTILVGCATALALREPSFAKTIRWLRAWPWFWAVATVGAALALGWSTGNGWHSETIGYSLIAVASASIILALFLQKDSGLSRFLSLTPLVFVGRVSYGIYLFHFVVVGAIGRLLQVRPLTNGTLKQSATAFVAVWIGSVAFAWVHYQLVEKRFLKLRNRFDQRSIDDETSNGNIPTRRVSSGFGR